MKILQLRISNDLHLELVNGPSVVIGAVQQMFDLIGQSLWRRILGKSMIQPKNCKPDQNESK
jgi:hypothetical protein